MGLPAMTYGAPRAIAHSVLLPDRKATAAFAAGVLAAALCLGCHKREAPEDALARATAVARQAQIAGLEKLIAQAEKGELVTTDLIAIGIGEDLIRSLLRASLPQETVVGKRLRVRLESAEPAFRGSKAMILLRARAISIDVPDASATIELGGGLEEFKLEGGKLSARVKLGYFTVRESSIGDLAADVLDGLVRNNLEAIQTAIPLLEIPVQLEESIRFDGLTEGAVVVKPGVLPLSMSVSQVIPVNQRLWVLLQAKAGPWHAAATPAPTAEAPAQTPATPAPTTSTPAPTPAVAK